jgi:hypothetical protein
MAGEKKKPEAAPAPPTLTPIPRSRTATIDDPLTTQVLAEVARRAQTMDLDPEAIKKLVNHEPEDEDTQENPHPHLRKRR